MKQLLLATAAVVGLSSAALAGEPVALTDSQLDNVTAGQSVASTTFPFATNSFGAFSIFGLISVAGPTGTAANPLTQAQTVPAAVVPGT
jgi:hypothetical protein